MQYVFFKQALVAGKNVFGALRTSVCVWLSPDEQAKIRERMAEVGICNLVDLAPVKEIVSLQRRCANNLNQIGIQANTYGGVYPDEIKALQKDYPDLWGPLLMEKLSEVVAL